jgi:membrane protein required for colicin V production
LNTVDLVILAILIFGAISGFRKGFVMEVISMLALIIAIFVGFKLLHEGINFLRDQFDLSGNFLPYLSFILLFVGTVLLMNLLGKGLRSVLNMTILGTFDKIAGGVFGLLKWSFGISALLWIFNYFQINPLENYVNNATVYPVILSVAPTVVSIITSILPISDDFFRNSEKLV